MRHGMQRPDLFEALPTAEVQREFQRVLAILRALRLRLLRSTWWHNLQRDRGNLWACGAPVSNKALHLTAYSLRSCVAPASGSR
jgi:hypothetical protein